MSHFERLGSQDIERVGWLTFYTQRIIHWYALFHKKSQLLWLIKHLHVSPFLIGKNGRNLIHMMCRSSGYQDILQLLTIPVYTFYR